MPPAPIPVTPRCPVRTSLDMLGGKWTMLLIYQLSHGPHRASDLGRLLPDISEKMLHQELGSLIENRLAVREESKTASRLITYRLTDQGKRVLPVIEAVRVFAEGYE